MYSKFVDNYKAVALAAVVLRWNPYTFQASHQDWGIANICKRHHLFYFYDLQKETSHDRGAFKVLDITLKTPILWSGVKPSTISKTTLDKPNSICQKRLTSLSHIQFKVGEDGYGAPCSLYITRTRMLRLWKIILEVIPELWELQPRFLIKLKRIIKYILWHNANNQNTIGIEKTTKTENLP